MNESKTKVIGNIIVALILSIAVVFSCFIGVNGLAEFKRKKYSINIKGYTKQQILSDWIVWTGYYDVEAENLKEGYALLEADKDKVNNYLIGKGFKEEDLIYSSISISERYSLNEWGGYTNEVIGHKLAQTVTISSSDIDKVTELSREATELLNEGVQFQSQAPEYHYTKLEDLKVSMLAEATQDATKRAELIAVNAGSQLGELTNAKLSSIQVTPLYSVPNDYYDWYGYGTYVDNDTVSLEKEVTVSVNCTFEVKR
ncbi:MAG: SIMPL domain-containing protein [Clostridiales bacterium]|nr:SIMPL domain-containing protein [Clostridiales bacterium]